MILGRKKHKESINCEYKEFCLQHTCSIYNKNEISTILISGALNDNYNSLVYQSLQHYFINVIPKYISSYLNANTFGDIYIGIDDSGEITGIPILNNINHNIIYDLFYKSILNLLTFFDNIHNYVSISIIPLIIDKSLINNNSFDKLLSNYKSKITKKISEYDKYYTLKNNWLNSISAYEKKINYLLNKHYFRKELIDFLNNTLYNESLSNSTILSLTSLLLSSQFLYYIHEDKNNINTITYWSCKYKDHILSELLKTRPSKPNIPIRIHPKLIFMRTTPLRLHFINNNHNIKYFIIKIHVKQYNGDQICYYKYPFSDKLNYKIRRINCNSQPFCSNY